MPTKKGRVLLTTGNANSRGPGKVRLLAKVQDERFYRSPFTKPIRQPSWKDLVAIEPLLSTLASIVSRMTPPTVMPDYWQAWSKIKATMESLAGWEATTPSLRTEAAFNVAHDHLLDLFERRAAEVSESHGGDHAAAG
jgi:hypothetical protein